MDTDTHGAPTAPVDIETFLSSTQTVPPASRVLAKLSTIITDDNSSIQDIVSLIRFDASLTGVLLRVSNSALFGGPAVITNLEDAVNRLGFREVYRITSAIAARQILEHRLDAYGLDPLEVFSRSLACAILCEELADWADDRSGAAYTFGLLHLIGQWVINEHIANFRPGTVYEPGKDNMTVPEWERKHFGFDYARVGGSLLKKWSFPQEVHIPVMYQLQPSYAPFLNRLTNILNIATLAVDEVIYPNESPDEERDLGIPEEVLQDAGLRLTQIESCIETSQGNFRDAMRALNVG